MPKKVPPTTHGLIGAAADDIDDLSISLRRVLSGFIEEYGGPEKFGKELARFVQDDDMSPSSRVSLGSNMAKLMGQMAGNEDDDPLGTPEQIKARLKQLDETENDNDD